MQVECLASFLVLPDLKGEPFTLKKIGKGRRDCFQTKTCFEIATTRD